MAMADEGATLGDKALRQIATAIRDIRRLKTNDASTGLNANARQANYQVKWDVDIDAATDSVSSPGLGTATIWARESGGDLYDTGRVLDVVNRSESSSYTAGDWGKVERINGEWQPYTGTGGGVTSVRFKIVSSDPTTLSGLATILAWDYGFAKTQIPATIAGNTIIEICDPMGCFLNEPNVDLTDRAGVAVYRDSDVIDNCRTGYAPFDGVWEVTSLCCKLLSCDVVI